jgi:hypothetical protein
LTTLGWGAAIIASPIRLLLIASKDSNFGLAFLGHERWDEKAGL